MYSILHTTLVFCSWTCGSAPATATFAVVDRCTATPEWRVPYACAGCIDCLLGKLLLGPTEDFTVTWYAPFSWLSLLLGAWKQKSKHIYMHIFCFSSIMPNHNYNSRGTHGVGLTTSNIFFHLIMLQVMPQLDEGWQQKLKTCFPNGGRHATSLMWWSAGTKIAPLGWKLLSELYMHNSNYEMKLAQQFCT